MHAQLRGLDGVPSGAVFCRPLPPYRWFRFRVGGGETMSLQNGFGVPFQTCPLHVVENDFSESSVRGFDKNAKEGSEVEVGIEVGDKLVSSFSGFEETFEVSEGDVVVVEVGNGDVVEGGGEGDDVRRCHGDLLQGETYVVECV